MTFTIGKENSNHPLEFKKRIYDLWNEGHSASFISQIMGGGITRNVVIGLVSRAKSRGLIEPRGKDKKVNRVYNKKTTPTIPVTKRPAVASVAGLNKIQRTLAPIVKSPPIIEIPPGESISIDRLGMNMCRWIFEDHSPYNTYCGKETINSSWCNDHYSRVYQSNSNYKRR